MPDALLTIKEIARRLDMPESNLRYYRDKFEEYLPHFGHGRKRRYLPQAVEVFSFIAGHLKTNTPSEDIAQELSKRYPRSPQVQHGNDSPPSTRPQEPDRDPISALLRSQARALEDLSGMLKSQSAQLPRAEHLSKEQHSIRKALVLLWRRQQQLARDVHRDGNGAGGDALGVLLARLDSIEKELAGMQGPQSAHAASGHSRDVEQAELLDRVARAEERLEAACDAMDGYVRELRNEISRMSPGPGVEARTVQFAEEMEILEQGMVRFSSIIERLASRIEGIEGRMDRMTIPEDLKSLKKEFGRLEESLNAAGERLSARIDAVADHVQGLTVGDELQSVRGEIGRLEALLGRLDSMGARQSEELGHLRTQAGMASSLEQRIGDLDHGMQELAKRITAHESGAGQKEAAPAGRGDLVYLSASISRLNHNLDAVSTRLAGLEQRLDSEIGRLNNLVHTCWSGVQKLSKALKEGS
jgi:DNA-binding transcriptional MerR regulator